MTETRTPGAWSFTWSLGERISRHLRAPGSRARSNSSSGYFLNLAITRDFSFRQANPGIEVSVKPRMAHSRLCASGSPGRVRSRRPRFCVPKRVPRSADMTSLTAAKPAQIPRKLA
jgi:hypothetical protein